MSPNRYLPETLGPGCAFLDYDNDAWMDLYLVNSGPCDFFQPTKPLRSSRQPLRAAASEAHSLHRYGT
jgi:enediyne biosynthesis protein E4